MTEAMELSHMTNRFGSLMDDRKRPKLESKPRTFPLAEENNVVAATYDFMADLDRHRERAQIKARKERERALEAAFASDSVDERSASNS